MHRVVIGQSLPAVAVTRLKARLGDGFEVLELGGRPTPELLAALATTDLLIGQTFTAEMAAASPRLKLIQAQGAGTDGIDRAVLPGGCYVANCYEHDETIAEFILGLMLAVTREIVTLDRNLRTRDDFSPSGFFGGEPRPDLYGHSAGIVGYGRIGRATAKLCRAFGMSVLATKGTPDPALAAADGLAWLGGADQLDELCSRADYIIVCAPLMASTRGLIGAAQFARMKPTAYVINIARGPVIDEAALYQALKDRQIAGAAIDVWYNYPPGGHGKPGNYPFEELDNLVMTPHVAGWTHGVVARRVDVMADNLKRVAAGEAPINVVAVG